MGSTGRREKSVAGGGRGGEGMKGGRERRSGRRGGYRPSGRDFLAGLAKGRESACIHGGQIRQRASRGGDILAL